MNILGNCWDTVFVACSVCYGAADSLLTKGLNFGIFALLIVLVGVLGCFALFFLQVRRRLMCADSQK